MSTYFASSAVRNTSKSFHYSAPDYRYFLHTSGPQGTRVNLQIKKDLFVQFVRRVGVCNTVGLPHLHVTYQGFGWFNIFVMDEVYAHAVNKFIARFNKWMNKRRADSQAKPIQVLANNSLHARYVVEAPVNPHHKPQTPRPNAPSAGALALLASRFSKPQGARHA